MASKVEHLEQLKVLFEQTLEDKLRKIKKEHEETIQEKEIDETRRN
jgi:hypothetical protein